MNVEALTSTYEGRQLFCEIMEHGGMWAVLYSPDASDVKYLAGRRSLALEIYNQVLQNYPESLNVINDEKLRREREELAKLENEEQDGYPDPFA